MNTTPPPLPETATGIRPPSWRSGFMPKLLFIGALALLLLIPLFMVRSLLGERRGRQREAVDDITKAWSGDQTLIGPVLVIPYRVPVTVRRNERSGEVITSVEEIIWTTSHACFLPSRIEVNGSLDPSHLHRGIYEAVVYRADLKVSGEFDPPDMSEWKIDPANILWNEAVVLISITDPRGITDALSFQLGGASLPMSPGVKLASFYNPLRTRVPPETFTAKTPVPFELDLNLNGSGNFLVAPVGMQTRMALDSSWADPCFHGAFLPLQREVTSGGFRAAWEVSYYGRAFPQAWSDADKADAATALTRYAFGVVLVTPVDGYRLVERATKYGILFIVLLFAGFFLFETLADLRIHPLQYLLVGAAICLFYLALLSFSELLPFGSAYLAAAAAATVLIVGYSAAVLNSRRRATLIGLELALIYGFLYITLQLQDYALMLGTAGLFVMLAVVMFATRRINAHGEHDTKTGETGCIVESDR